MSSAKESDEDDDSEEWGKEELHIPTPKDRGEESWSPDDDHDDWVTPLPKQQQQQQKDPEPSQSKTIQHRQQDDQPVMIVDLTKITRGAVHCKFDRHAVNDAAVASAWRKRIEQAYDMYAKDLDLVGNGTILPCGMSVWKQALSRVRDERPGHFFAPIFPPSKAEK